MMPKGCTVLRKGNIDEALKNDPIAGKRLLEPLKSFSQRTGFPVKVLEDSQVAESDAEVHFKEDDLWLCLEGNVKFVYGGELINPYPVTDEAQLLAKGISNGKEVVLSPGDWLWIPAGQPHIHTCDKTARMVIIKIPSDG